ncbi:BMP family ABC transporter substrate-binding protein [Brachyspira aalborgi]|uniref:BMP family ABC transporter substrate-binding protein n=1 Tax=Brachyspira aalborgi TaxID=29522 RepID=A0A5C8EM26_9SPIR|nr:BMP family ABC transporter substrate-binding protein [Brachyspira aalborgi]TXJ38826.1 BMP family ABC transporter substrate-binding protein [Brachyspira aalborgi]TXJ50752.1 BMP family ABC transporter substrate-binding protein [Brachyspira aalborgi]
MKNFLKLIILSIMLIISLSCKDTKKNSGYELALITDIGTIDDKSFTQGSWEGLKKYAEEKGITYKYYKPAGKDTDSKIDSIYLAISSGAKLIVTPGYLFEPAIYKVQDTHPEINFVLLDGTPQDGTYTDFRIEKNVYAVLYAEEEAGFLAGYGVVKEGYTNLGVMGGMAEPSVIRFGYGFVQGADYAAKELGVKNIKIDYTYIGGYEPTPEVQTKASSWFIKGVQVIFAPAGGAGNSVMSAAEQNKGYVVGVDVDQSVESPTVITSAMKMIGESVYNAIDEFYKGNFPGGKIAVLDAKVHGIGLPMETSKFKNFTKEDYDNIYKKLIDGSVEILKDTDAKDVSQLPLDNVKVNFIQ